MFRGASFLPLAKELATRQDDEAAARTAISRAHYAAYHAVVAPIRLHGLVEAVHHTDAWNLILSRHPTIAGNRNRLRGWRESADYELLYNPEPVHSSRDE